MWLCPDHTSCWVKSTIPSNRSVFAEIVPATTWKLTSSIMKDSWQINSDHVWETVLSLILGEGQQIAHSVQTDLGVILCHHPDIVLHDAGLEVAPSKITDPQNLLLRMFCYFYLLSPNSDRVKAAVCLSSASYCWQKSAWLMSSSVMNFSRMLL